MLKMFQRATVKKNERALLLRNGSFDRVLRRAPTGCLRAPTSCAWRPSPWNNPPSPTAWPST